MEMLDVMNQLEHNVDLISFEWKSMMVLLGVAMLAFVICFPNTKLSNGAIQIYIRIRFVARKITPVIHRAWSTIENLIGIIWRNVKRYLEKIYNLLKKYAVAFFSFIVIILLAISCILDIQNGRTPDWMLFSSVAISLLIAVYAEYQGFWEKLMQRWSKGPVKFSNYIVPALGSILLFIFGMAMVEGFSDLNVYAKGTLAYWTLAFADKIFYISLSVISFYYVFRICKTMCNRIHNTSTIVGKSARFVICLFQIVQLLTLVYIAIFHYFPDTFPDLVGNASWEVCFELTYHSAMALWAGGSSIESEGLVVHFVEMIETFIFAVFISFVVFGELSNNSDSTKSMTYEVEIIEKRDSNEVDKIDG